MNKWLLVVGVLFLVVFIGFFLLPKKEVPAPLVQKVSDFEECRAAGFPVREIYPAVCSALDGTVYTQEIGNEIEYSDEIIVDSPRPNQTISSPLTITGQARGPWYFEATFPFELQDANGVILGIGYATAQDEWMTEEFVPFSGEIIFTQSTTPEGQLVIRNANPSGLPEQEEALIIPISFQE